MSFEVNTLFLLTIDVEAILGLLLLLVFFSVFVGIAMLAAGVLYRLLKQRGKPVSRDARIVDGEFRVVGKAALPSA